MPEARPVIHEGRQVTLHGEPVVYVAHPEAALMVTHDHNPEVDWADPIEYVDLPERVRGWMRDRVVQCGPCELETDLERQWEADPYTGEAGDNDAQERR